METQRAAACLCVLLVGSSCASSDGNERKDAPPAKRNVTAQRPLWLDDPVNRPHPNCPPDRFLVAVGHSDKDAQNATLAGRDGISKQISASIKSSVQKKTTQKSDLKTSEVEFLNVVAIEQTSAFQHAALIEAVGQFSDDSGYYQLVCLERARAASVLTNEISAPLGQLRAATEQAQRARSVNDRPGFSQAFRQASEVAPQCAPSVLQLEVLDPAGSSAVTTEYYALVAALGQGASDIRARSTFSVGVEGDNVPPEATETILSIVSTAVRDSGFSASTASACGPATYHVTVRVETACRYGGIGWTCQPRMTLSSVECATKRTAFIAPFTPSEALKGTDVKDQGNALRKALGKLRGDELTAFMKAQLRNELPVMETR